ncbi:hypothetical protein WJX74_006686 [Apatococcus lobatus]|uniref:Uncharacterized protein n=1 Tax=Apatococcus lobatus TaxID=904363 RepID=A0AAW1SE55_9CHLO
MPGSPKPGDKLQEYFQKRVEEFERERSELLERVEGCSTQRAELHQLEWQNRRRTDEICELQKALSDAHMYLYEERARLLQLQADNDELRLQESEDRRRIQHLLAITQPMEQEITYQHAKQPHAVTLYPHRPPAGRPSCNQQLPHQQRQEPPDMQERVMRTVYLPTSSADTLAMRVDALQAQLEEQRAFAAERVGALLEDRRIREQDEAAHRQLLQQQLEQTRQQLATCQKTLQTTTRDFILARRDRQDADGRVASANELLSQERKKAVEEVTEVRSCMSTELASAKVTADGRLEEQRQSDMAKLEAAHSASQGQSETHTHELQEKLERAQEAVRQLEIRRALDQEGWDSDVTLLRRQMSAVDRKMHQMRLVGRLDDDERLDAILRKLSHMAPSLPTSAAHSAASQASQRIRAGPPSDTASLVSDVRRAKQGIDKLAERTRDLKQRA